MSENEVPTPIKNALKHKWGFKCVEQLGRGSFGRVVKVKYGNDSKTPFAIKILKIHGESEELKLKCSNREINVLLLLKQLLPIMAKRNIVQYHDSWMEEIEGLGLHLFIQMELCWKNLWDFIYTDEIHGGPQFIQVNEIPRFYYHVFQQILNGICFIHGIKWVHRDIHPGNILIANPNPKQISDIGIKIADFGLARQIEIKVDINEEVLSTFKKVSHLSKHGDFDAPELSTDTHDFKVDVYSAGLVLYFISRYPEESTVFVELEKLKEEKLDVDERLVHKDDEKLSWLIKNLTQVNPKNRFSASSAMKYMFPEEKNATDSSVPKDITFLVRREGEDRLSQYNLKTFTLSGIKDEISRHTSVPKRRQILQQERVINGELKRIKIENDDDVKNIIDVALKKKQKIVVVVSERKKDVEMAVMSAEPTSSEENNMAEAMIN